MMRVARQERGASLMSRLSLGAVIAAAAFAAPTVMSPAPAIAQQAAAEPLPTGLVESVENFWHYSLIARYELAGQAASQITSGNATADEVLRAFEQVAADRRESGNLDNWLLRWQGIEPLRENVNQIMSLIAQGRFDRRGNQDYIESNIKRLINGERAYQLGLQQLRNSGELAVPLMIQYLGDINQRQYHAQIRRALVDMGRLALNPLVVATQTPDQATLLQVINVLGGIGYDVSVPHLARLANDPRQSDAVRDAATEALIRMGVTDPRGVNAAQAFYELAEKFYYDTAAITANKSDPAAFAWYWDDTTGLVRRSVPPAIFNELMAMRSAKTSLRLNPSRGDALALWLASNYQREVELPAGESDATRAENEPPAHFYGVAAGTQYLNEALLRALRDRNAQLALRVIDSLAEIAGRGNLFDNSQGVALTEAMTFPDKLVRFEAAMTLAAALPREGFIGQDRVVPLIGEALAQTGNPGVLLLAPTQDEFNTIAGTLRSQGYEVVGGTTAQDVVSAAALLPSVDVIVAYERGGASRIDMLSALSAGNPRIERTPRLVVAETAGSPFATQAQVDTLMNVTQAEPAELKPAIDAALARASVTSLTPEDATAYSLRAADLLARLAISNGVLDARIAQPQLLTALSDGRAEVVTSAGNTLALLDTAEAQQGLVEKASDASVPAAVRVSLFKSLATSAKTFGNRLGQQGVDAVQSAVADASNLDVRQAAAEARGALNLPAGEARPLVLDEAGE